MYKTVRVHYLSNVFIYIWDRNKWKSTVADLRLVLIQISAIRLDFALFADYYLKEALTSDLRHSCYKYHMIYLTRAGLKLKERQSIDSMLSRGCELEFHFGQYYFWRFTKFNASFVTHQWAYSLCGRAASCFLRLLCGVLESERQYTNG